MVGVGSILSVTQDVSPLASFSYIITAVIDMNMDMDMDSLFHLRLCVNDALHYNRDDFYVPFLSKVYAPTLGNLGPLAQQSHETCTRTH